MLSGQLVWSEGLGALPSEGSKCSNVKRVGGFDASFNLETKVPHGLLVRPLDCSCCKDLCSKPRLDYSSALGDVTFSRARRLRRKRETNAFRFRLPTSFHPLGPIRHPRARPRMAGPPDVARLITNSLFAPVAGSNAPRAFSPSRKLTSG